MLFSGQDSLDLAKAVSVKLAQYPHIVDGHFSGVEWLAHPCHEGFASPDAV
jgi:hypothetical protein